MPVVENPAASASAFASGAGAGQISETHACLELSSVPRL